MKILIYLAFIVGLCVCGIAQDIEYKRNSTNNETRMFPQIPQKLQDSPTNSNPQDMHPNDSLNLALPNAVIEETLQESEQESDLQKALERDLQNDPQRELEAKPDSKPQQEVNTKIGDANSPFSTQDSMQNTNNSQEFQISREMVDSHYPINSLAKNVYLEVLNPPLDILYVHQIVPINLKLLVLADYSTIQTEFIFENNIQEASVEILNPNENWNLNAEDSSLRNTFYFKIKQPNYTIPQIKIIANTSEGETSERTQNFNGKAIKLERQGSFSQVLAQDLKVLDTKITDYDTHHNLAVIQLQSTMGNLFDFHLASYTQQGIESRSGDYKQSEAFYYAIVPKDLNTIRFDYFNLKTSKYTELQIENIAIEDRVSTQSDIKPKNNYQFFKIALMIFFTIVFFGLYLYKRKLIFILFAIIAFGLLLYFLTLKTSATLKANVPLRIQPTFNSTIILTTQEPMQVEILGQRSNYYKVLLQDDRIGWIKRNDLQN